MKKVLLVYATAGIGHVKASLAVKDALEKYKSEISYENVDILDYTNTLLKWIYHRLYIILVKYTPTIWALIYYCLDIRWVYNCIKSLRSLINRLNSKKFADYVCRYQPDIIVSTHFFPSEVISRLIRKRIFNTVLISVITDFKLHTYWVSKEVDCFIVADDTLKEQLKKSGIEDHTIMVFGIPVESKFYESLDKDKLYGKLGIKKDRFTVLIASGGFGVGPVEALVEELASADIPIQLLIVCGKNHMLYEDINQFKQKAKIPIKVYGFVENMHELMEVADLLVSKSGGMTVSEAIAKELPMIIVSPIPGQEMRNCQFMLEHKAAVRENAPSKVKKKVIDLFNNKEAFDEIHKNIKAVKKPNPASNLANFITSL